MVAGARLTGDAGRPGTTRHGSRLDHVERSARTRRGFPVGAAATIDELDRDPHPLLARLRASEPVSWLPALDGWLVTRHDLVLAVLRDAAAFTVDDPRFSTAQVIG